jgi:hypothetical protein
MRTAPDRAAERLAAHQHDAIARRQAVELGFGHDMLRHRPARPRQGRAEGEFARLVRRRLGVDLTRQVEVRTSRGRFFLDFAVDGLPVGFEVDGFGKLRTKKASRGSSTARTRSRSRDGSCRTCPGTTSSTGRTT